MYRHGDLLIVPTSPSATIGWASGTSIVLAEGETTGHKHVLEGGELLASTRGGRTLLHVIETAWLRHEEHAEIEISPGFYEVRRQRIYAPAAPRWVED